MTEPRAHESIAPPSRIGPVLVVDDDAVSRAVLSAALAGANLPHIMVSSGSEALAACDMVPPPSVILLDLVMPPPDGYQVLRILRAREDTRDTPIVVLTALDADDEVSRAFEAGADDFVRKPFKAPELIARVRGQLRLKGAMDELARKERDAQVVLELTQALASNLDMQGILFTMVRRIAEVAQVDRVSIVLVPEDKNAGFVVAASDDAEVRDLRIDLTQYPEIEEVLSRGEPLVIPDVATHPVFDLVRTDGRTAPFASLAIVPILYDDKALGVLFLRSRQSHVFGRREVALSRTVASAMAIALRNARILQRLEQRTREVNVAKVAAEQQLVSMQRYADFFESSADGIAVIDTSGHLLFANARATEITGYGEEELRGRSLVEFFVGQGDEQTARYVRKQFLAGDFHGTIDVGIRCKDGAQIVASVNMSPVMRDQGAVLCTFRDVTQQRAVEAEFQKTKNFLERVIDASSDAIISSDTRGKIVLFNRAAERISGRRATETVGSDVRGIYPPGDAERVMRKIRDESGRVEGMRVEILDTKGTLVPVSLSGALLYDGEEIVGSVGVFTDLREKMRMEQRLKLAQEQLIEKERQSAIAELAGATAHELNQPLTSVMNYAVLLRRLLSAESPAASAADVIEREAERMAEIVRKIGKITKYETKSYVGSQKILDLDASASVAGHESVTRQDTGWQDEGGTKGGAR